MRLIDQKWNPHLNKYEKTWIADTPEELTASFDPDSSCGSAVLVISTGDAYMKNCCDQWQKIGSNEVIA